MKPHSPIRSLHRLLLIPASLLLTDLAAAAEPMVSVVDYSFCRSVMNLEPVGALVDPAELQKGERLHLWLNIQINKSGLRYLRSLGKLPVYLRWGRDGWLTDPAMDVGITPSQWQTAQAGIKWKAQQGGGVFSWRTNANKATPINGRYYASILDANKKVITHIDLPAEYFRPEITVSR